MTPADNHNIIINRILASAREHPGRLALEVGDVGYTYEELLRHT